MWALIVLGIVASSATGKSSLPTLYSGERIYTGFTSEKNCEDFKKVVLQMNKNRNSGDTVLNVADGIIDMQCKKM
jgi:hypothetical protein